jgi:hypothetical protein
LKVQRSAFRCLARAFDALQREKTVVLSVVVQRAMPPARIVPTHNVKHNPNEFV